MNKIGIGSRVRKSTFMLQNLDDPATGSLEDDAKDCPYRGLYSAIVVDAIDDYLCWHYAKIPGLPKVRAVPYHDYASAEGYLLRKVQPLYTHLEMLDLGTPEQLRERLKMLKNTPEIGLALLQKFKADRELRDKGEDYDEGQIRENGELQEEAGEEGSCMYSDLGPESQSPDDEGFGD